MTSAFDEAFDFDAFNLDVTYASAALLDAPVTVVTVSDIAVNTTAIAVSDAPVTVITLTDSALVL